MRFSLPFVALATVFGLASANPVLEARQEAVRFGIVDVNPTSVKLGEASAYIGHWWLNLLTFVRLSIDFHRELQLNPRSLATIVLGCLPQRQVSQWLRHPRLPAPAYRLPGRRPLLLFQYHSEYCSLRSPRIKLLTPCLPHSCP